MAHHRCDLASPLPRQQAAGQAARVRVLAASLAVRVFFRTLKVDEVLLYIRRRLIAVVLEVYHSLELLPLIEPQTSSQERRRNFLEVVFDSLVILISLKR